MASVLIVEDYDDLRDLYQGAFQAAGYTTVTAATGAQALAEVEARHFDAIVLDLLMLGLSGMDVLRRYNFREKSPSTKIAIVSNLDSPNLIQKAEELGAVKYLVKSQNTPKQIVEAINELLGQTPAATPAAA